MRFPGVFGACGIAWLFCACTDGNGTVRSGQARLVLEIGGPHASLRQALQAAGIDVAPLQHVAPPAATPAAGALPQPASLGSSPVPEQHEPGRPAPAPAVEEAFFLVTLAERQTLIHLARKHLGDGNRFREILALNGWSEADARGLRAGQKVKIPRASAMGRSQR